MDSPVVLEFIGPILLPLPDTMVMMPFLSPTLCSIEEESVRVLWSTRALLEVTGGALLFGSIISPWLGVRLAGKAVAEDPTLPFELDAEEEEEGVMTLGDDT